MFLEELTAIVISAALTLSIVLFGIEVFIKGRGAKGQGLGLVFSIVTLPLYFVVFCDKFPGRPLGPRNVLLVLPDVTKADVAFSSSVIVLILLALTYALRLGIYTRLFIIPALTMTEAQYRSRGQVEQRANDLTAPVLAYLTFALVVTAVFAGAYALPAAAGGAICAFLLLIFFFSRYLRHLRNSLLWLLVQLRILAREFWLWAGKMVVGAVLVIARLEKFRTQPQPGDAQFFAELEERLHRSEARARIKIERDYQKLRNLM